VLTLVVVVVGPLACVALARAARRAGAARRAQELDARPSWRLPSRLRVTVARALRDADIDRSPEELIELWAVATIALALVAATLAPELVPIAVLASVVAAPVGLWLARTRHERRFTVALPGALEQVAAELRGGGTVTGALERLASGDTVAASDLRRVTTRTRLGLSTADALASWPLDHDAPGVRAAAGALAVAATMGGSAATAIDGLAASLRARLDAAAEAHALAAQARLSAVVVGAAPLGYLVFSSLVDRRTVLALLTTGIGRVCLVVGLGLEALAALWIRRVVRSEA
jgi:tight adherence protein B